MVKEPQIEQEFITKLSELKYIPRPDIRDKHTLEQNFREKFEQLNRVNLTDSEFSRLRDEIIDADIFTASKTLRQRNAFEREDGTPLQYTLVNIDDWCKNSFEVINQLRINTENSFHRYDVIILINGIPVVQIELKTLQVSPRRAIQQVVDYKNDPGNGYTNSLLCFMQLFIVSNQSDTIYFANNRNQHFNFNADEQFLPVYRFADEDNNKIPKLNQFADRFLAKCFLGETISRYMVLVESEQKILVMRPYQVNAVKAIVNSIEQNRGNGYIWHTTGSGKTLTSFKASTLLKSNDDIEKCLFVVDRKDLDRQTREEFNKFQEGCVEENTNTETLVRRLLSTNYADKVIVTTIQKLGLALDADHKKNYKERLEPLRDKRMVFIFDECHRSQFGDNHTAIKEFFPKAQLFGFTGTPIFEENAVNIKVDGQKATYKTTKDLFENEFPPYTITNAIDDKNVLRFHIDYYKPEEGAIPTPGQGIAQKAVVEAILKKHDAATNYRRFNAILATASINNAIEYHQIFKEVQAQMQQEDEDYVPLNIACVFSPPTKALAKEEGAQVDKNVKDVAQLQEDLEQEKADNEEQPEEKLQKLKAIIADYNKQFGTNHTVTEFDLYYQDIQKRIKDHQYIDEHYAHENKIDIVIVVDMLLTGFDSKYLNTLYVDKNLRYHGLIQAFSRTNRVLNDTKPYGNILDFRSQKDNVEAAIELFSGEHPNKKPKEIWLVAPAPVVIKDYEAAIKNLDKFMKGQGLECNPSEVHNLKGDIAKAEFVQHFKEVQRLRTQLDQYTDITEEDAATIKELLPPDSLRSFRASYLDTAKHLKVMQGKTSTDTPPEVQELDFEFVLFASAVIDYDYIMQLVAKATGGRSSKQKMTKGEIINLLTSSANLLEEREEMARYIDSLDFDKGITEEQIREGYEAFKQQEHTKELNDMAGKYGLEPAALQSFIDDILYRMIFDGEKLADLMAPLGLGWKDRARKELELMAELVPFLNKLARGREISGLEAYE